MMASICLIAFRARPLGRPLADPGRERAGVPQASSSPLRLWWYRQNPGTAARGRRSRRRLLRDPLPVLELVGPPDHDLVAHLDPVDYLDVVLVGQAQGDLGQDRFAVDHLEDVLLALLVHDRLD